MLRTQVSSVTTDFSNRRTCEMELIQHAGIPYHSILYLVGQAAR